MDFEPAKILLSFSSDTTGDWIKQIEDLWNVEIKEPIKLFIHLEFNKIIDLHKENTLNVIKTVLMTLVQTKILRNTQQVVSICAEKKLTKKKEVCIFISRI